MKRTRWLQETKQMRFEEAYDGWRTPGGTQIFMEGVPRGLTVDQVADRIRSIEGVAEVHHLNLWAVCSHIFALSAHVEIKSDHDEKRSQLMLRIEHELSHKFNITHTTIQFDCAACNGGPLIKKLNHMERQEVCSEH